MTTTKDIARELGISHSTVSRVLNEGSRISVAPRTRQRVTEAASRMNYRPNVLARALKSGRTNIVGLYSGYGTLDTRNRFFAQVLSGLQSAGAEMGLDLLLHSSHYALDRLERGREQLLHELHDGRVDGFFVFTAARDPLLQQLLDSHLPIVSLAESLEGVPSVVADDTGGMTRLVEQLLARGHRRLLFLAPQVSFISANRRREAFVAALENAGIDATDAVWYIDSDHAKDAFERWHRLPPAERASAICGWNDLAAYRWMKTANARGLRTRRDYAITGFDGFDGLDGFDELQSDATQLVCSAKCDWHQAGQIAMRLLHQRIGGATVAPETVLPTQFIAGHTI